MIDYEFYETPNTFVRYLFEQLHYARRAVVAGQCCEPCVGSEAIINASQEMPGLRQWKTNDLDSRWRADHHEDARYSSLWKNFGEIDWTISNPAFTPAIEIISHAIERSRVGVAMHLRASIHEVLKTGVRRTWMAAHQPTGILWLPRFAYQRSKSTGKWATDSVCACWVIWLKDPVGVQQFIRYAPESVIDALDAETPAYRARMDKLMADRQAA